MGALLPILQSNKYTVMWVLRCFTLGSVDLLNEQEPGSHVSIVSNVESELSELNFFGLRFLCLASWSGRHHKPPVAAAVTADGGSFGRTQSCRAIPLHTALIPKTACCRSAQPGPDSAVGMGCRYFYSRGICPGACAAVGLLFSVPLDSPAPDT